MDAAAHMRRCLELAQHGAGHVSPNPLVGAVLVDAEGQTLGEGWHARYGGPHAEVAAIHDAEARHGAEALRAATLYVNLEPCSHHGKTPPCADLLIEKQIPRVVVGMEDPFPAVAGRGLARLREAGVTVTVGVLAADCQRLNAAFVHHVRTGRPRVTLKIAQTLDGRIATASGDSQWVTGEAARAYVHWLRLHHDGVLVGSGTARTDDPALTVRHVEGRQPQRFVLDRTGSLPPTLQLFADSFAGHTTALTAPGVQPAYADALAQAGGRVWPVPATDGHLDLAALLDRLGQEGGADGRPLQSLLVEAGPGLATALLQQNLLDELYLFIAPKLLGGGLPSFEGRSPDKMAHAHTFAEHTWERIGPDLLFRGIKQDV